MCKCSSQGAFGCACSAAAQVSSLVGSTLRSRLWSRRALFEEAWAPEEPWLAMPLSGRCATKYTRAATTSNCRPTYTQGPQLKAQKPQPGPQPATNEQTPACACAHIGTHTLVQTHSYILFLLLAEGNFRVHSARYNLNSSMRAFQNVGLF